MASRSEYYKRLKKLLEGRYNFTYQIDFDTGYVEAFSTAEPVRQESLNELFKALDSYKKCGKLAPDKRVDVHVFYYPEIECIDRIIMRTLEDIIERSEQRETDSILNDIASGEINLVFEDSTLAEIYENSKDIEDDFED